MKILGFRSGQTWKKIIAILGYLMIIGIVISAFSDHNNIKTVPTTTPVQQESTQPKQNETSTPKTEIQKDVPQTTTQTPVNTPTTKTQNTNPDTNVPKNTTETSIFTPTTPSTNTETPKQTDQAMTVYGTKTGTKYHLDGCRTLKSKIPMTLSEAKAKGLKPCGICNPPQ